MIETKNVAPIVSRENILDIVSEKEIFENYLGKTFVLNQTMRSPLRKDDDPEDADDNPSFMIYENSYRELKFNDLGRPGSQGDCFDFVKALLKKRYPDETYTLYGACVDINRTMKLGLGNTTYGGTTVKSRFEALLKERASKTTPKKPSAVIKIRIQAMQENDYLYWHQFGITKDTLKKYKVFAVKQVYRDGLLLWSYTYPNPIYAYHFDSYNALKVYRPREPKKQDRWRESNSSMEILQGYDQLPLRDNLLIITKSLKDVMVLSEMGFSAIAPLSEGRVIPSKTMDSLKKRFKGIVTLYDNDTAGIKAAQRLLTDYGLEFILLKGSKDISDLVKDKGISDAKDILIKLINGCYKEKRSEQLKLFNSKESNNHFLAERLVGCTGFN